MKISDFLRMKITPENRQFDMIKNIRFLDDKNIILAGKNTSTVSAFCETFFDYVNRNYRSSRGAEKLIKSYRKKLNRLSGSESMIVVQRILAELSNDYAINHYHITCEMINPAVKKTNDAVKPAAAVPVSSGAVQQAAAAVTAAQAELKQAAVAGTTRIQALESELGRLQPEAKSPLKAFPDYVENTQATQPAEVPQPAVTPQAVVENIPEAAEAVNTVAESVPGTVEAVNATVENAPQVDEAVNEEGENIPAEAETVNAADDNVPETVENVNAFVENTAAENVTEDIPAATEEEALNTQTDTDDTIDETNADESAAAEAAPAAAQAQNRAEQVNYQNNKQQFNNKKNKKDKKQKRIAGDLSDARMKPGKEIKPLTNLKEAAKFMDAGLQKSKLNLNEIPCIAVIEENKVPTMEEVPCIAVIEDNSVPTMEEVPYVGVEDKPEYLNVIIGHPEEQAVSETPVKNAASQAIETPVAPAEPQAVETPVVPVEPVMEEVPAAPEVPSYEEPAVSEIPAPTAPAAPVNPAAPVTPVVQAAPAVQPVQPAPAVTPVTPVVPATPAVPVTPVTPVAPVTAAPKDSDSGKNNIRKIISNAITLNKQVIFVGPSGTGKTYEVRKYARRMTKGYDGFKFVQFHQSYEYSDFIEGLRPVNIVNSTTPTNVRLDGIFKAFCRKIVEDNLEYAIPGFMSMYSEKKQKVVQRLYESIRDRKEAIDDGMTNDYFGPETEEYKFEKGTRDYYLIIDEVNRADVSKVFGDVLFALDEDYRGIENRFDTRLSNLKAYHIVQADDIGKANYSTSHIGFAEQMKFDCFENGFFIPRNLHIVCTMNEVDNDASTMDFAFKHKFNWININTEDIMLTSLKDIHKDKSIFWLDRLAENVNLVNRLISEGISPEHRIGPAFFKNLNESSYSIDVVFDNTIEPILKEYLKGKPEEITDRFISECRKALKRGI